MIWKKIQHLESIQNDIPFSNYLLATIYENLGNKNEALKYYEISNHLNLGISFYSLYDFYLKLGKDELAIKTLILACEKGDFHAYSKLGDYYSSIDLEKSKNFYLQDILGGFYHLEIFQNQEENLKITLEDIFMN